MTVTVNTIGFGGKGLKEFVGLLRDASVSKVIDTRLRPDGQLSAYARRRDLEFFLESYESIEYEHNPDLAPTPEILDAYRRTKDWEQLRAPLRSTHRGAGDDADPAEFTRRS